MMNIKTDAKTTIEATGHYEDGCFRVRRKPLYDGAEDRFDTISFHDVMINLDIPKGEYKMTLTLEKTREKI